MFIGLIVLVKLITPQNILHSLLVSHFSLDSSETRKNLTEISEFQKLSSNLRDSLI